MPAVKNPLPLHQIPKRVGEERSRALAWAITLAAGMRVGLSVIAAVGLRFYPQLVAHPLSIEGPASLHPQPGSWQNLVAGPWQRWDAIHYTSIALGGYSPALSVFPPAFPLLEHVLRPVFGNSFAVAGVAISFGALVLGLYAVHRLVSEDLSADIADRAVLFIALFPTAVFFAANYPEALFFALSAGTFLAARRGQFVLAGALAALATLTRDQGILLILPLGVEVWRWGRERRRRGLVAFQPGMLAVLLAPLALLTWYVYVSSVLHVAGGPPGAESRYWGDHLIWPWTVLADDVRRVFFLRVPGAFLEFLDLVVVALMAIALPLMWRRLPHSYTIYAASNALLAVSREVNGVPSDIGRFVLVVFPFFVLAAMLARRRWVERLVLATAPALLALATFHFTHWGYIG
jgi:Mannosyltransferase (PIG-V)